MSGSVIEGFIFVSSHAVRRFRERFAPQMERDKVVRVVAAVGRNAVPFGGQKGDDKLWLGTLWDGRELVLVTVPNAEKPGVVVRTVLTRDQAMMNMQQQAASGSLKWGGS